MAPVQPELKKVCFDSAALLWTVMSSAFLAIKGCTAPAWTITHTLQYLDKRLFVQLNGSRKVIGVLRGYDVRH